MTAPSVAAVRFLWGCGLGAVLGIFYDFLRPLRRRTPLLCDLFFLLGGSAAWLQLMFGICRGDIRLWGSLSLLLGIHIWQISLSPFVRPVFDLFWRIISGLIPVFCLPWKKFWKKQKF